MQPSTDDLLIRQISALISATADAASPSKEYAAVHGGKAVRNPGCPLRRKAEDRSNIRQKRIRDKTRQRIDLLVAASMKIP